MCDNESYQVSFPVIFGGPTGDYTITPPINGPCEMCVIAVSTSGSNGGAAYIGQSSIAEQTSSIAATGKAGSGTPGIYIDGNSPYHVYSYWFPIDGPLGMQVVGSASGILVTCLFRKKKQATQSTHLQPIYDSYGQPQEVTSTSGKGTLPQTGSRLAPNARK